MAKTKSTEKKTTTRKPVTRKSSQVKPSVASRKPAPAKQKYTDEYAEYLARYELDGDDRPRLSPGEFERLDDELLELLELQAEGKLDDEQIIRIQEIEYLLLDSE